MRITKKIISAALALCMTLAFSTPCSYATAPTVTVDETAYLMLDYYGELDNYSVVKGCDLNGNTEFNDYGKYSSVSNMSTLDQPEYSNDGVAWKLSESTANRFYYEVVPKNQKIGELPWTVDISYSLNGTPAHAEKLAGASGLITVDVTATPNKSANAYYRDNFILVCGMMVDTDKNNSFSAEGAQFQSFGSYQMAFFIAMPKRDGEFEFNIGSDSFETTGVILTMMPATMSQLDDVSDMKEHKKNLEDASNAMDSTIADVLDMMSAMSGGMQTTVEGLGKLDQARDAMDKDSDSIKSSVSKLRSSLKEMEKGLNNYGEFLGDSKMSDSISDIGDEMSDTMEDMGEDVIALNYALRDLKVALQALGSDSGDKAQQMNDFINALSNAETVLNSVNISSYERYVNKIEASVEKIGYNAKNLESSGDPTSQVYKDAMAAIASECNSINSSLSTINEGSKSLSSTIKGSLGSMSAMSEEIEDLLEETSRVVDDTADLLKDTRGMLDSVDTMLSDSSDLLNDGAKISIAGMTQMLNDVVEILKKTDNLQANRATISDIVRDEWHRLDDDFGVLDIDTSAEKVSFTSDKNSAPRSLQVVMRTKEIELDDEEDNVTEAEDTQTSVSERISKVFETIGDNIAGIFK